MPHVTESGQAGAHLFGENIAEIVVTPRMIEAGAEELSEHRLGDDLSYMLERVYRAMAYAALASASVTKDSK